MEAKEQAPQNNETERMSRHNYVVLALALLTSLFTSGILFGWPSLVVLLKDAGIYHSECTTTAACDEQEVRLNLIFTCGFSTLIGSRLPLGTPSFTYVDPVPTALSLLLLFQASFSIAAGPSLVDSLAPHACASGACYSLAHCRAHSMDTYLQPCY